MIRARNEFTGLCYPLLILPWISLPLLSLSCFRWILFFLSLSLWLSFALYLGLSVPSLFLVRFLWSSSWDPLIAATGRPARALEHGFVFTLATYDVRMGMTFH